MHITLAFPPTWTPLIADKVLLDAFLDALKSKMIKYILQMTIYRPPTATSTSCARARCRQGEVPKMPRQRWHKGLLHPHFYRWSWWWCWWWCYNPHTRAITFPSSCTVRCLEKSTYTSLFQCLSFCQMRILRITSYLIVSIRFHSWLFSIWALQAPVDIRDISCLGVPFGSIPGDRHTSSLLQNT